MLELHRLVTRLVRQRPRQLASQCLGPVVLLLQRLSQLSLRTLGGLLELRRLVTRLARQRSLRLDVPLRFCQLARQRLGPVVLLLQRQSQLRCCALGNLLELLELHHLVARLARQRSLRLDVPLRFRQLARQCLGPVVLLLQRQSQLRCRVLGSLLELRRVVARLAR